MSRQIIFKMIFSTIILLEASLFTVTQNLSANCSGLFGQFRPELQEEVKNHYLQIRVLEKSTEGGTQRIVLVGEDHSMEEPTSKFAKKVLEGSNLIALERNRRESSHFSIAGRWRDKQSPNSLLAYFKKNKNREEMEVHFIDPRINSFFELFWNRFKQSRKIRSYFLGSAIAISLLAIPLKFIFQIGTDLNSEILGEIVLLPIVAGVGIGSVTILADFYGKLEKKAHERFMVDDLLKKPSSLVGILASYFDLHQMKKSNFEMARRVGEILKGHKKDDVELVHIVGMAHIPGLLRLYNSQGFRTVHKYMGKPYIFEVEYSGESFNLLNHEEH